MKPKFQTTFHIFTLILTLITQTHTQTPCAPLNLKTQISPMLKIQNTAKKFSLAIFGTFYKSKKTRPKKQNSPGSGITILTVFGPPKNAQQKIFFRLEIWENILRWKNGFGQSYLETKFNTNGSYFFLFGQNYDQITLKIVNLLNFESTSKNFRIEGDLSFNFLGKVVWPENEDQIVFEKLKYSGNLTLNLANSKMMS